MKEGALGIRRKIPRRYRTNVSERRFQEKLRRRVPAGRDRTFLEEAYRRDSRGRYHLREDLTEAELARLVELLRAAGVRLAPFRRSGLAG